jgi:putative acetyltransferase
VACVQTQGGWSFHRDDIDNADVEGLIELHFRSMRAISPPDACHVLPAAGLREPGLTLWPLREDGRLVAIGALKELSPDDGEVKSMRTAPDALGRGVGAAMLAHIVAQARARRYRRLSLETGSTEEFAAALHLYQRQGFRPFSRPLRQRRQAALHPPPPLATGAPTHRGRAILCFAAPPF